MTDTQKLWITTALLGSAILLFAIFIEWTSLEAKYVAKHPPLIRLFAYTSEEEPYSSDYKGMKIACIPGSSWGCPIEVKYVHGLFPTPNISRTACAIFGLLVPFLLMLGASYLFSTTSLFRKLIIKIAPNKALKEGTPQSGAS